MQNIGRFLLISLAVAVAVLLVVWLTSRPADERGFFDLETPLVIAHQGGERLRPSNTMASFRNAMDLGVDVLEMDIHSSADDVLVVIHDDTVDRTTDGTGRVHDLTLAELQQLDAGEYWTDDDGQTYPYRGQGITIPALEEVLGAFPGMPVNIEIKQVEPSIAADLCTMLRQYGRTDLALVASFHGQAMEEFRAACPEVATSMVESEIRVFYVLNRVGLGSLYSPPGQAFQVPERSGSLEILTTPFINGAQANNIAVHAWTIDETEDMARLLELGLDGIITDRPDRMLELLGR
jgi:glycerophosphoryl diester phosphodiesterase